MQWLCEEHPDAVRVDYAINEGGGERIDVGGKPLYLCAAAEKMSAPFRLRVRGRSGHASMPGIADNALVKAARLIERLGAYEPEPTIGPEVAGFLDAALGSAGAGEVVARLRAVDAVAADTIEPLLAFTLSPTMISASEQRNVVPGPARSSSTGLPGQTPEDVEPACARSSARATTSWRRSSAGAGRARRSTRRSGTPSPRGSRRPSRARPSLRLCCATAPTRTGCARPSAPSRTASSR